jgi:hypothetical protein
MGMKKKLVSFAAVIAVAGAIGAAPASAAPSGFTVPDAASLAGLCKSVKQPSLQSACNKGVATLGTCASAGSVKAAVSCLSKAAGSFNLSKVKLPFDVKSLIAGITGSTGGTGGIKLPNLGGIKLPSLGGLAGIKLPGGFDLSKLLGSLKR